MGGRGIGTWDAESDVGLLSVLLRRLGHGLLANVQKIKRSKVQNEIDRGDQLWHHLEELGDASG